MSGILVSYRSEDAAGHAGRVIDRLRTRLAKRRVLKDLGEVAPGEDFVRAIEDGVAACDTVLVVIGRRWLTSASPGGRRLDVPNDPVRLEISTALRRTLRVIPVLVAGAVLPQEQELPSEIRDLARRQAVELRDGSWDADVENLVVALERVPADGPRQPMTPQAARRAGVIAGMLTLAVVAIATRFWLDGGRSSEDRHLVRIAPELTLTAHSDILAIAALPRRRIASTGRDETVTIWNLDTGENQTIFSERGIFSISGIPDGRLALGLWGYIEFLNPDTGKIEETIDLHDPYVEEKTPQFIQRLNLLPDGRLLSLAQTGVGVCDPTTHTSHFNPGGPGLRFAARADGRIAMRRGEDDILVWNSRSGKIETTLEGRPETANIKDVAWLPDGRMATTSENGLVALWTLETGKEKTLRPADTEGALFDDRLFLLPDHRLAVVRSDRLEVWNLTRDRPDSIQPLIRTRRTNGDPIKIADGRLLLPDEDNSIVLWNADAGRADAILEGHIKPVEWLLLLEDNQLVSASWDRTIRIWRLPTKSPPSTN